MWHRTKSAALLDGMRAVGRNVDPELLLKRAAELGIRLPVVSTYVCAPSVGGQAYAHKVPIDNLRELAAAIDIVIAAGNKRAA